MRVRVSEKYNIDGREGSIATNTRTLAQVTMSSYENKARTPPPPPRITEAAESDCLGREEAGG